MSWRRLLHEPLTHFLLAGSVLFGLSAFFGEPFGVNGNDTRIYVSADKIQQLHETWSRQRGTPPTDAQLRNLVEDFIREEVLYREAIASGLDQDDTIVRRRLSQKVEFLAQSIASTVEPSDIELQQFFEDNKEKYIIPTQVAFSHVYFSSSRRGARAPDDARTVLTRLTSDQLSAADASGLGDRFMLQYDYPPQSQEQIRDLFGIEFASQMFELPQGEWTGPVESSYGMHLIYIQHRILSRTPTLKEIHAQVMRDLNDQRIRTSANEYYRGLRSRFDIEIDEEALLNSQRSE